MPLGIKVAVYTRGLDSSDVLVLPEGGTLEALPRNARVGTSSLRRIENLKTLRSDFFPVDIRGTIEERLLLLDQGHLEAVIIAKAALLRLKIERNHLLLPGKSAPLQGKLAIIVQEKEVDLLPLLEKLG